MLYDRPVRELMRDAAEQLPSPTTPTEIISWFGREYPLVKKTTVAAHITGLTAQWPCVKENGDVRCGGEQEKRDAHRDVRHKIALCRPLRQRHWAHCQRP